ncbi:MAG: ABC transporter permease [Candidatus Thorarchaeota archaeon]|nr:ABC transporter permease [Candidatus Thorarchaeota archaeon]
MAMVAIYLFFGSAIRERKPEYAIIRAVGATQKQVYSMVFSEFLGLVLAALSLSALLGIIVGYSTTFMILGISPYAPLVPLSIALPFAGLLAIIATEFVALVVSCYYPARNAGKVNMLEELRNL